MKDIVCVMDELTKEEMVSDSFPEDKLFVTGHAYLDKLFNSKDSVETEKQGNGILKENKVDILFLSQPLSIIGVVDYKIHPLETCIQAVSELKEFDGKKLSLKIKPHPIESELDEISILLKKFSSKKIEISITEVDEDLNKLIGEADIVIGYNTIAMFEARAMNKRTISLNVVPVKYSLMKAMETAGIEITNCSKEEIKNCLKLKMEIKSDSNLFAGGIENCIKLIKSELNLS